MQQNIFGEQKKEFFFCKKLVRKVWSRILDLGRLHSKLPGRTIEFAVKSYRFVNSSLWNSKQYAEIYDTEHKVFWYEQIISCVSGQVTWAQAEDEAKVDWTAFLVLQKETDNYESLFKAYYQRTTVKNVLIMQNFSKTNFSTALKKAQVKQCLYQTIVNEIKCYKEKIYLVRWYEYRPKIDVLIHEANNQTLHILFQVRSKALRL